MSVLRCAVASDERGRPVYIRTWGMVRPLSRADAVRVRAHRMRRALCARSPDLMRRDVPSDAALALAAERVVP